MTKKEWLGQYRALLREERAVAASIEELRILSTSIKSPVSDGMPRGSGAGDGLASVVGKLDQMERRHEKMLRTIARKREEILDTINALQDSDERTVLTSHYINGLTWEQVAECMGYTDRNIYFIHGRALQHIRIDCGNFS